MQSIMEVTKLSKGRGSGFNIVEEIHSLSSIMVIAEYCFFLFRLFKMVQSFEIE